MQCCLVDDADLPLLDLQHPIFLERCDAVALEDSSVCVIPYGQLEHLSREFTDLLRQFHKIMSREIVRDHGVMLLLGSMRAEERLAAFLLNLTQRLQARGFSPSALVLRMTREEIGTYLGLKLETVSRCFSKSRAVEVERIQALRSRQPLVSEKHRLDQRCPDVWA